MSKPTPQKTTGDFQRFGREGHRPGTSRAIGQAFCTARDFIARGLVALGVKPNTLTIAGFVATCGTAVCFFLGGSHSHTTAAVSPAPPYLLYAAGFLILASAFDMLDGAVARIGNLATPFGAFLDSAVDRMSDAVVYIALIGHFLLIENLTYAVLAAVALTNALLISYTKARSENVIPNCGVGYWLRGERSAAILIAAFAGAVPAVLWQQAILPGFTVLRRIVWTHRVLAAKVASQPLPDPGTPTGPGRFLKPWRFPRGSLPYDLVTGINIAFIIATPHCHPFFGPAADPLRAILV
ncbi:MAG: CDP-alcohol phosphatidyltransferase family protein [Planctomycetota bacterium]